MAVALEKIRKLFKKSSPLKSSTLISTDPDVYLLPRSVIVSKDHIETVRVDLDSNEYNGKEEKVIILVGQTGTGKTTLINAMVNHILGVKWKDNFRYKLIQDPIGNNDSDSQTQKVTVYSLFHNDTFRINYNVKIVDTPGFGDTRGMEKDADITDGIQELFRYHGSGGIDHIDCIGFTSQAHNTRLDHTQKYVIHCVLSLFGKDIKDNILLMMNFADMSEPKSLSTFKDAQVPYARYFQYNNSGTYSKKTKEYKAYWKLGKAQKKEFFNYLGSWLRPKSLEMSLEVLDERLRLANALDDCCQEMRKGLDEAEVIKQRQKAIKEHRQDILDGNDDHLYQVIVQKARKVPIPDGEIITNCLQCQYTCHRHCRIKQNDLKFRCIAIDPQSGMCKQCTKRCVWSVHKNNGHKWEYWTEAIEGDSEDIMGIACGTDDNAINQRLANLQRNYDQQASQVLSNIDIARHHLNRLKEIALKPDPLTETGYVDHLIKVEEANKELGWEKRKENLLYIKQKMAKLRDLY